MNQYSSVETKISKSLGLKIRPVAVKFLETPPKGVTKFEGAEPSGCSFWRIAAAGKIFYTVPSDHYNCAVGSHTHNIPLPQERAKVALQLKHLVTPAGMGESFHVLVASKGIDADRAATLSGLNFSKKN